jgi:hypothetical protein
LRFPDARIDHPGAPPVIQHFHDAVTFIVLSSILATLRAQFYRPTYHRAYYDAGWTDGASAGALAVLALAVLALGLAWAFTKLRRRRDA